MKTFSLKLHFSLVHVLFAIIWLPDNNVIRFQIVTENPWCASEVWECFPTRVDNLQGCGCFFIKNVKVILSSLFNISYYFQHLYLEFWMIIDVPSFG